MKSLIWLKVQYIQSYSESHIDTDKHVWDLEMWKKPPEVEKKPPWRLVLIACLIELDQQIWINSSKTKSSPWGLMMIVFFKNSIFVKLYQKYHV